MKKIIIIGIIFLLVACIPMTTAIKVENSKTINNQRNNENQFNIDEPPDWAIGNFTGIWGFNINGQPYEDPIGLIVGYYGTHLFAGLLTNTTVPNGWMWGYRFSIFMFGMVANLDATQKVPIVGIGGFNETGFYYRFMSITGPTFYMAGHYNPF